MDDLQQTLFLMADEMRGMASIGKHFAANVYETERAERIMELAEKVAALADRGHSASDFKAIFDQATFTHISPANGVDAAVFNSAGEILLIQRRDNARWAMPGGLSEIGMTLAETAVKELWEEAGLRGSVIRLLGIFDGPRWGSEAPIHLFHPVFHVACLDLTPIPGIECLDAAFFAREHLPSPLHAGHDRRVPFIFDLLSNGETYFDPASAASMVLSDHQRR